MQWFIGIHEGSPAWQQYAQMAKVAIHTALERTSLEPHCIYDGGDNDFTAWLDQRGVPIIRRKSFLRPELEALGERENDPALPAVARGALLRVELPGLQEALALDDYVLYTDCDVIFRADVVDMLRPIRCDYFAVAAESNRAKPEEMNSGVMWMNLPGMHRRDAEFRTYMREHIDRLPRMSWDQGAYSSFYKSREQGYQWQTLPPELNWKPYWGDYTEAKIIHFHGPKPFQRNHIDSHWPELKHLTGGAYAELCARWDDLLREAEMRAR